MIGNNSIDFLRHAPVETAQSGFNMDYGEMQLGGRKRPSQRGISVTIDKETVRPFSNKNVFYAFEHTCRLACVTSRSNVEVHIRCRHFQTFKEYSRHLIVIVLACVQQNFRVPLAQYFADSGSLYELRPRAYNGDNLQQGLLS